MPVTKQSATATHSNALERAREMDDRRATAKKTDREALLSRAREYAIALADSRSDSPSPEDIIAICDQLDQPVSWMDRLIAACEARREYHGLSSEANTEEDRRRAGINRIRELSTANQEAGKKIDAVMNRLLASDGSYKPGVTLNDMASLRDMQRDLAVAKDEFGLLRLETTKLQRNVERLLTAASEIDPGKDAGCDRPCPDDFAIPGV